MRPPKYYDQLHYKENPYEHEEILYNRDKNGKLNSEDNTTWKTNRKRNSNEGKTSAIKRNLT